MEEETCRPQNYDGLISGQVWDSYSARVKMCGNDHWQFLVESVNLMHKRISHMNYMIARYLEATHP